MNADEYHAMLRLIAQSDDWNELPEYLQDVIDNVLADEAEAEDGEPIPLADILAEME